MSQTAFDLDPGAPQTGPVTAAAIKLANFGDSDGGFELESPALLTTPGQPASLAIDRAAAHAFLTACVTSHPRVGYGLGAKIKPHGATPGSGFTAVDCSGFVRECIWRSTTPNFEFKDGSVVQHEWVKAQGFRTGSIADGQRLDGALRIAFLSPADSGEGIGHVVLIHGGHTLESHGGLGPDSRPWTGTSWQAHASVYVLDGRLQE